MAMNLQIQYQMKLYGKRCARIWFPQLHHGHFPSSKMSSPQQLRICSIHEIILSRSMITVSILALIFDRYDPSLTMPEAISKALASLARRSRASQIELSVFFTPHPCPAGTSETPPQWADRWHRRLHGTLCWTSICRGLPVRRLGQKRQAELLCS